MTAAEGSLRQRQAAQVRTAVLDAVIGMLETKDLEEINVADVAKAAGTGLRTVYRYFPDRQTLLQSAGEHIYNSLGLSREICGPDDISASFLESSAQLSARPLLARALVRTAAGQTARSEMRRKRIDAIGEALSPLAEQVDGDTARWAIAAIAHLCSASSWVTVADESGMAADDARAAVSWAIDALVAALREQGRCRR